MVSIEAFTARANCFSLLTLLKECWQQKELSLNPLNWVAFFSSIGGMATVRALITNPLGFVDGVFFGGGT